MQVVLDHAQHALLTPPHPLDPLPKLLACAALTFTVAAKVHALLVFFFFCLAVVSLLPKHPHLPLLIKLIARAHRTRMDSTHVLDALLAPLAPGHLPNPLPLLIACALLTSTEQGMVVLALLAPTVVSVLSKHQDQELPLPLLFASAQPTPTETPMFVRALIALLTQPHPLDPLPKLLALAWPTFTEMPKPAHALLAPTVVSLLPNHPQPLRQVQSALAQSTLMVLTPRLHALIALQTAPLLVEFLIQRKMFAIARLTITEMAETVTVALHAVRMVPLQLKQQRVRLP